MTASPPPSVWVAVVSWNLREATQACLASLARITYPRARVLVVDNASSDGSPELVRERFPHFELLVNAHNRGYAAACNQALARALEAGADRVCLLNNDTRVAPDFLDELTEASSRPGVGLVGPKILFEAEPERIWSAGGTLELAKGRLAHRGLRELDGPRWMQDTEVDWLTGCALLATRACIESVGPLDEGYEWYGEDVDWCWRARRAGFRCWFAARARVWHQVSASSGGGTTPFKAYHQVRSQLRFLRRHARPWHWATIPLFGAARGLHLGLRFRRQPAVVAALARGVLDAGLGRRGGAEAPQPGSRRGSR